MRVLKLNDSLSLVGPFRRLRFRTGETLSKLSELLCQLALSLSSFCLNIFIKQLKQIQNCNSRFCSLSDDIMTGFVQLVRRV